MVFYEPVFFELERLFNDPSLSKQSNTLAGFNGGTPGLVRSFKPR